MNEKTGDWKAEEINGLKQKFWWFRRFCYWFFGISVFLALLSTIEAVGRRLVFSPDYLWIGIILSPIAWYISHCLKFVKPWERLVVWRWGANFHWKAIRLPGVRWYWYGIDKGKFIKIWEQIADPDPIDVITADSIVLKVNPVIYFTIDDPLAFVAGAEKPIDMMVGLAQTLLLAYCGKEEDGEKMNFDKIRASAKKMGEDIAKELNKVSSKENEDTKDNSSAGKQSEAVKEAEPVVDVLVKSLPRTEEEVVEAKSSWFKTLLDGFFYVLEIPFRLIKFIFTPFIFIHKKIDSRIKEYRKKKEEGEKRLKAGLSSVRGKWGIKVSRVQIQGLLPSKEVIDAMEGVYKAQKLALAEVEKAKGLAGARKELADINRYEKEQDAVGDSALITKKGEAYSKPGGEMVYGEKLAETMQKTDKIIIMSTGGTQDEALLTKAFGGLAGGMSVLKGDKKEER